MTAPKTKFPIEAFGPQLMSALVAGGTRRVVIRMPNRAMAKRFQLRINMLRQRMRQENHPDYMIATRSRCSVFWGTRAISEGGDTTWRHDTDGLLGALVVLQPHDIEFNEVLAASGVHVNGVEAQSPKGSEAQSPPAHTPTPEARHAKEDYDDLLDELERKGSDV